MELTQRDLFQSTLINHSFCALNIGRKIPQRSRLLISLFMHSKKPGKALRNTEKQMNTFSSRRTRIDLFM